MKFTARAAQKTNGAPGKARRTLKPFENEIPCESIVSFDLKGRAAGGLLLSKGKEPNKIYRVIFGFETKGIHPTMGEYSENIFDSVEDGIKELMPGEHLTFHFSSFSSDMERQNQLSRLCLDPKTTDSCKTLLLGAKKRIRELKESGLRKPKKLRIYASFTINPATADAADTIEKILGQLEGAWNQISGWNNRVKKVEYSDILEQAFVDGFIRWEQILAIKMNLILKPMDAQSLWEALWDRFNDCEAPPVPQQLTFTEDGIAEETSTDWHLTSALFPQPSDVPQAHPDHVTVRGKEVGVLVFADKPGGWASKAHQLRYLWDVFAREAVFDTEVFCQITKASEAIVKEQISRITRQAIASQSTSQQNANVDVVAGIKQRKAMQATEELYEGATPVQTATVFLVHRKTVNELQAASRYFSSCFQRPASLEIERNYAWRIWLQTLPTTWDRLLSTPFDRRLTYLSKEVPAFLSLVQPRPVSTSGLELISDEGGVPIHLDFFKEHRNVAYFATTRAGKSVMISEVLQMGLAHNLPIIVMDFPPSDAASTFKDWTHYNGGAYFDIGRESANLLEIPDLSSFTEKEQAERMTDFKEFVCSALMLMVFGSGEPQTTNDRMLKQGIRSIIIPAVDAFYNHPNIKRRFAEAYAGGMSSQAWQEIPTLNDFIALFDSTLKTLPESVLNDPTTAAGINQIKRQLGFWVQSRVGRAIARPTTCKADVNLMVYALRGLSDSEDAAVLALSAYSRVLNATLSHPASICFIDEFSVLLEWPAIGRLIARLTANGAKSGIRVFLAAQDPNTIDKSDAGPMILQNMSTRLIGRIQPVAQESFVKILKIPPQIIARNASESFYPAKHELYSQWLLDEGGTYTYVRYYVPPLLLAVVANNPKETQARQAFFQAYPDRTEALVAFTDEYVSAIREGREIRIPHQQNSLEPDTDEQHSSPSTHHRDAIPTAATAAS
jgi:hypothetical protein